MKKLAVLVVAVFTVMVFVGVGFADQQNYGCGLGSMMFEGQDGLLSQTCAATFNGSFYSQLFGITTGTSKCNNRHSPCFDMWNHNRAVCRVFRENHEK